MQRASIIRVVYVIWLFTTGIASVSSGIFAVTRTATIYRWVRVIAIFRINGRIRRRSSIVLR